jgi:hypothetical protein
MPFKAAKPATCTKCPDPINTGDAIAWTRGKGAQPGVYHLVCPSTVPAAISIAIGEPAEPVTEPMESTDEEPVSLPDDEMPEIMDEPKPGTRRWFETATMADREYQCQLGAVECLSRMEFARVVGRYSRGLGEGPAKRLARYARGLWDGMVARLPEYGEDDLAQLELDLYPTKEPDLTHGAVVQAWRTLVSEWATESGQ